MSIEAAGGGAPQVYGNGKMVVYNNLLVDRRRPQKFYLAQIDRATGAGKTALIDLLDLGDICGDGTRSGSSAPTADLSTTSTSTTRPTATAHSVAAPARAARYNDVSQFDRHDVNGAQATNGTWIHISVPLRATRIGIEGLWAGRLVAGRVHGAQGGNDTTTWQVSVSGNPVHLLMP